MKQVIFFAFAVIQSVWSMNSNKDPYEGCNMAFKKNEFFRAIEKNDFDTIKHFMGRSDFDINVRHYSTGYTGLMRSFALNSNNDDILNAFLADVRVDITAVGFDGRNALILAFLYGMYPLVERFIQSGRFDLNHRECCGNRDSIFDYAFHAAVHSNQSKNTQKILSIAVMLLNHNDFKKFPIKSEDNYPVPGKADYFYSACENGNVNFLRILMNHPDFDVSLLGVNALRRACECDVSVPNDNAEVVKLLLSDERISINEKKNHPIIYACYCGKPEIVKLLAADPRCDLNVADEYHNDESFGDGVFVSACRCRSEPERVTELISVLLKNPRIDVNLFGDQTNFAGAVCVAARRGIASLLKLLMSDDRLNISTAKQPNSWRTLSTPIVEAIERGHWECAHILLDDPRCDFHEHCASGLEAVAATCRAICEKERCDRKPEAECLRLFKRLISDERFNIERVDYWKRQVVSDYLARIGNYLP
ncbi:MAG: ankyrin repeat domain-containing protein [Holosporaceae bacterium]|jgi:hypothetical protein|nr:ankyrin repeat domain-containing protein [Holosporaceae bacterium]